jgi:hypothetical protein
MPASNYPIRRPSLHHAMPRGDSQTVAHESAPLDRLPTPRGRRQRTSDHASGNSASSHMEAPGAKMRLSANSPFDGEGLSRSLLGAEIFWQAAIPRFS